MTSKERLLAAINHEETDCVPVNPRTFAWLLEQYGQYDILTWLHAAKEYDFDPIVEVTLPIPDYLYSQAGDYTELSDVDVELQLTHGKETTTIKRITHTPAGRLEDIMLYPRAGGIYGIAPNPEKIEPMIKTRDDLERLKYLLPDPSQFSFKNIGAVASMVGDAGLVQVRPHHGVDHMLVDSMGLANAMIMYHENKELFRDAIKIYHEYYKQLLKTSLDAGAKIIFESWYNCSLSAGWSPAIWREFFKPCIKEDAAITHAYDAKFHYYDDGKFMPLLDDYADIGMDIFSTLCPPPVGDADFQRIKERIGDKVCLNGGVDLQTLLRGSPGEVEMEVKRIIEILAPGGGFMLGTSDSIRNGSPAENVKAFFSSARKHGKY